MKHIRLAVALTICLVAPSITLAHTMRVFPVILHEGVPQLFVIMVEPPGQRPTVTVGGLSATVRNLLKGAIVEVTLPGSLLTAGEYRIELSRAGEVLATSIDVGQPDFATLLDTLDGMTALVTQVVTDLAAQADFFEALDSVKTQINLGSFELAFDEGARFFRLVNDSPEITYRQTRTLQDLTLFVGFASRRPDCQKKQTFFLPTFCRAQSYSRCGKHYWRLPGMWLAGFNIQLFYKRRPVKCV
jgi:hypothetical protein